MEAPIPDIQPDAPTPQATTPTAGPPTHRRPGIRSMAAVAIAGVFILSASYIRPSASTADPGAPTAISMGWLESPDYRVEIFLTDEGTRYDVYDAYLNPIAMQLMREELYHIDPILDPEALEAGTSIGIVTDDDDF